MTRIVYQDIDQFAEAMRGTAGCFVRTAPAATHWWIEGIELATSSMQQLQTGGPFTFAGTGAEGTLTFQVPLTDPGRVRINGQSLESNAFLFLHGDCPLVWTGSDACRWATVTFPSNHTLAAQAVVAFAGESVDHTVHRRTPKLFLDEVKELIDSALAAEVAGQHALESALATALMHALEHSLPVRPARNAGRPQLSRSAVIAKSLALIDANPSQPLFIDDLCRATQVSERALRNIFQEYFGVGPMRLLKIRQLHEIRAALLRSQPGDDTVTHIAARFGVLDPSLLARNYKILFGETPSRTLHRAPAESQDRMHVGWLRYASRIFQDDQPLR
ncbi:AraC family transcriptional regulator [Peristeroidobacter agariperforans]|uniref:AraC family transcriptional regulator n=1 Tax=Peristeroidobacter agariperforans TaxID=268404 RepID=UPI00101B76B4|nr:AraC family transcriptional regulator [Peristeroidobacter agariperforans]